MSRPYLGIAALVAVLLPAATASAQSHDFTVSLLGGVGTAFDADPDPGFSNLALQVGFAFLTDRQTQVGFRLGRMDFDGELVENAVDADLTYLTVAGEYRFNEGYYESGIYLGLGLYDFGGRLLSGGSADETGVGLTLGITGDFSASSRLSVLIDLGFHYADLDTTSVFLNGLVGVAYKF